MCSFRTPILHQARIAYKRHPRGGAGRLQVFSLYTSFSETYRQRRLTVFPFFPLHGGLLCPLIPFPIPARNKAFPTHITARSSSSCSDSSPTYPTSLESDAGQNDTGIPSESPFTSNETKKATKNHPERDGLIEHDGCWLLHRLPRRGV